MHEEMSTFHDEVFESPSDSTMKDVDSKQLDESELTGSALDKNELERSHLMLWVLTFIWSYITFWWPHTSQPNNFKVEIVFNLLIMSPDLMLIIVWHLGDTFFITEPLAFIYKYHHGLSNMNVMLLFKSFINILE